MNSKVVAILTIVLGIQILFFRTFIGQGWSSFKTDNADILKPTTNVTSILENRSSRFYRRKIPTENLAAEPSSRFIANMLHLPKNNSFIDKAKVALQNFWPRDKPVAILRRKSHKNDPINLISNFSMPEELKTRKCGWILNGFQTSMGLGNLMFGYASLYGIAKTNDKIPICVSDSGDLFPPKRFFKLHAPMIPRLDKSIKKEVLKEDSCCKYTRESGFLDCELNYRMYGYFQSWKYFENSDKEIREQFTFAGKVARECKETINSLVRVRKIDLNNCFLIGAHMRRGDFVYDHKQSFGHSPANGTYLRKAIEYYRHRHKGSCVKFLIYGNDESWNRAEVPVSNDVIVMKLSSPAVDLCILSSCNHTIMSTGTFGFWAGYLAGGHVTYQKEFARYGSSHYEEYVEKEFFLPNWVPL